MVCGFSFLQTKRALCYCGAKESYNKITEIRKGIAKHGCVHAPSAFTYPSSKRDRLTCCNSESLSPSTPAFFILSLPARSQLFESKANTSEKNEKPFDLQPPPPPPPSLPPAVHYLLRSSIFCMGSCMAQPYINSILYFINFLHLAHNYIILVLISEINILLKRRGWVHQG